MNEQRVILGPTIFGKSQDEQSMRRWLLEQHSDAVKSVGIWDPYEGQNEGRPKVEGKQVVPPTFWRFFARALVLPKIPFLGSLVGMSVDDYLMPTLEKYSMDKALGSLQRLMEFMAIPETLFAGFSFSGLVGLTYAWLYNSRLKVAAWYPPLHLYNTQLVEYQPRWERVRAMFVFGEKCDADDVSTREDINIAKALASRYPGIRIVIRPGAGQHFAQRRMQDSVFPNKLYNQEATERSWEDVLSWATRPPSAA